MTQVHQEANCCLIWDYSFSIFCIRCQTTARQIQAQVTSPLHCNKQHPWTPPIHDLLFCFGALRSGKKQRALRGLLLRGDEKYPLKVVSTSPLHTDLSCRECAQGSLVALQEGRTTAGRRRRRMGPCRGFIVAPGKTLNPRAAAPLLFLDHRIISVGKDL